MPTAPREGKATPAPRGRLTNRLTPKKGGRVQKPDWSQAFLVELGRTANVGKACWAAGVSRSMAYKLKQEDPGFANAWREMIEFAIDMLEEEARRRAVEGTERPVFCRGKECGRIREYSDTLLIFLLKAHRPERFRDSPRVVTRIDRAGGGITITLPCLESELPAFIQDLARHEAMRQKEDAGQLKLTVDDAGHLQPSNGATET